MHRAEALSSWCELGFVGVGPRVSTSTAPGSWTQRSSAAKGAEPRSLPGPQREAPSHAGRVELQNKHNIDVKPPHRPEEDTLAIKHP